MTVDGYAYNYTDDERPPAEGRQNQPMRQRDYGFAGPTVGGTGHGMAPSDSTLAARGDAGIGSSA